MRTMDLSYSDIVLIIYASIYGLGFGIIIIIAWDSAIEFTDNAKAVWAIKEVFAPTIIGIYDTVTDTAVLIEWGQLWYAEQHCSDDDTDCNADNIDAGSFFFTGLAFIALYRILKCAYFALQRRWWMLAVSSLFDLDSLWFAYREVELKSDGDIQKIGEGKALVFMKGFQLGECILEALPQLVLQSVYVIRYQTEGTNHYLIIASIFGSLLSITAKYAWFDTTDDLGWRSFDEHIVSCHWSTTQQWRLNLLYITRISFRVFQISARMAIYSLMWAVVGGMWMPLFILFPLCAALFRYRDKVYLDFIDYLFDRLPSLVATLTVCPIDTVMVVIVDIVGLTIITPFAMLSSPQCGKSNLCANIDVRLWRNNELVRIFLCVAYISVFGYVCTYTALYLAGVVMDWGSPLKPVWQPQCCVDFAKRKEPLNPSGSSSMLLEIAESGGTEKSDKSNGVEEDA